MKLVEYVEKATGEKPLLLIFEDYINDQDFYIDTLCAYLGCGIDKTKLCHRAVHKSYTDKQLRIRRQLADKYLSQDKNKATLDESNINDFSKLKSLKDNFMIRMSGLFMRLARFAPDSWLDDEPLIDSAHSEKIKDYFSDDWAACYQYVEQQSIELGVSRNVDVST